MLTVPRKFVVPSTQQWNFTIQRELAKNWVLEVGYVGTHAIHLRETRTNIQAKLATATHPVTVTAEDGTPFTDHREHGCQCARPFQPQRSERLRRIPDFRQ